MPIADALRLSLSGVVIDDRDQAVVELAYEVAREIDGGGDVDKLSYRLQGLLEALLLTPRARAAVTKGAPSGEPTINRIDELRNRRKRHTQAVDSPDSGTDA